MGGGARVAPRTMGNKQTIFTEEQLDNYQVSPRPSPRLPVAAGSPGQARPLSVTLEGPPSLTRTASLRKAEPSRGPLGWESGTSAPKGGCSLGCLVYPGVSFSSPAWK